MSKETRKDERRGKTIQKLNGKRKKVKKNGKEREEGKKRKEGRKAGINTKKEGEKETLKKNRRNGEKKEGKERRKSITNNRCIFIQFLYYTCCKLSV